MLLHLEYLQIAGVKICKSTMIKYLKEKGYGSAKKLALTETHPARRLAWAKDKANWSADQWRSVFSSDESRFTVMGNDGEVKLSENLTKGMIVPTAKSSKWSVMLLGLFLDRQCCH
jgi:hypothetical protein